MQNGAHSGTLRAMSKTDPVKKTAQPTEYLPRSDGEAQGLAKGTDQSKGRDESVSKVAEESQPREIGGPSGPEPTRYGDWERKGRCIDF